MPHLHKALPVVRHAIAASTQIEINLSVMKRVVKYLTKRQDTITFLLKKPKYSYTSATFHKLRVEIKKLDAFFELINFCSRDFKRKKTFKPFKVIFRQSGKVRDLEVEEAISKEYFQNNLITKYRISLKESRLKEQETFYSILNKSFIKEIEISFHEINNFIGKVKQEKLNKYLEKKTNQLIELLGQHKLRPTQIHKIRKQLKKLHFNQNIIEFPIKKNSLIEGDKLPDLIGKWQDCKVIARHLEETINVPGINKKEIIQLEIFLEYISSESKELLKKIKLTIHRLNTI